MVRIILLASLTLHFFGAWAQYDSLVYQQWFRQPYPENNNTVSNQKQIITKEQILYSGYNLISDVLQLIDGFTFTTWNGDRWNLALNGVGNYQNQNWVLMVDGVKLELLKLDAQSLNTIAVSVYDIERIEIINATGNYLGEFNDKGIIHIVTKKNKPGFNYRLLLANGNESGDPHLNVVNNPGLNVHEFGTVLGQSIGYKKNNWSVQANQFANNYFYRDTVSFMYPAVAKNNRNPKMYNTILGGRILVNYANPKTAHQVSVNLNHSDDVVLPASIFNPITGTNKSYQLGYLFRLVTKNGIIQYRGSYLNRNFTGNDYGQLINHTQKHQTHLLHFTKSKPVKTVTLVKQIGVEFTQVTTSVSLNGRNTFSDYQIRPYYSGTYPLTKKSSWFTDISLATNFKHVLPKILLGYYKQPSIISNWSFVASYTQRNQFQNNTYPYLLSLKDTSNTLIPNNLNSQFTLDYFFNLNVSKYFMFSFNSGIKYLNNELYFVPTDLNQPSNNLIFNTEATLLKQTVWTNRLNLHYNMSKGLEVSLNYLHNRLINGQTDINQSFPTHKFTAVLSKTLPARFYLFTRYYYQSATTFINPYIAQQAGLNNITSQYTQINSMHLLDAGVTKKLLKEYLILNLSIRNLLNTNEVYQANGASFNLRLFLSVKINI